MKETDYNNYRNFKDWNSGDFGYISKEDETYFDCEFSNISKEGINNKRILELGFGNGSFAAWSTQKGCEYYGTELISELVIRAKESGFNAFEAFEPLDKEICANSIDYVVAFDVFEHLNKEEIDVKLSDCWKVLKNGGELIGRVPSGDSPFSTSIQNGDFTHKISLGSSMIKQIAISNGYTVKVMRSPSMPLRGQGLKSFIRRFIIKIVRGFCYPLIGNIFMGGGNPILTPNLLFILKKYK